MRISVVIPAYNEDGCIGACLESLRVQRRPADEIVVIDNNCSDGTVEIAQRYDVRVIHEHVQGIWAAAAAGYDAASGDVIARCDADSRLPADWLERIETHFNRDGNPGAVTGPGKFYDCPGWAATLADKLYMQAYFTSVGTALSHPPLFGSNFAMRRTDWQAVRTSTHSARQDIHDDIDLSFHLGLRVKITYEKSLAVGISSRPFRQPLGMARRYGKGFRTIFLHWGNEKPWERRMKICPQRKTKS